MTRTSIPRSGNGRNKKQALEKWEKRTYFRHGMDTRSFDELRDIMIEHIRNNPWASAKEISDAHKINRYFVSEQLLILTERGKLNRKLDIHSKGNPRYLYCLDNLDVCKAILKRIGW